MSALGFALVLTAAVCHATWNFFVKRINGGPELVWLFSAIAVVLYLPVVLTVALTADVVISGWGLLFVTGSACLHLGYFLLLQTGYRNGDLSLVYPTARATGPLLSTSFAVAFLGETITLQLALGAAALIIGVVCLTGGFRGGAKHVGASIGFGLGAGVLIGSYTVWDAYAVSALAVSPILLDFASSIGRTVLLSPVAARRRSQIKALWQNHRLGVIVIAIFNPLAYILVLYAMTFTPVVYVAPIRETSVLLTVLMGSILLGEGDLMRRLKWAALILLGVVLLATA